MQEQLQEFLAFFDQAKSRLATANPEQHEELSKEVQEKGEAMLAMLKAADCPDFPKVIKVVEGLLASFKRE